VATVSDLAFVVLYPMLGSVDHEGTSPHRIFESLRAGSRESWRITGTGWEGATL
jgi:hypothetical protein